MCLRGVLTPCECDLLYYPSLIRAHPSTRAAACGCGHSRCYTNGAKAAPKRSRRSSPLGPATGARLLLDDDLNLDVCIGRHWRNHAVLLDEWALALLLARQRRRRRCSRLSPLPKALLAIDTDLDRGRREHQHSPSGTPLPVAGSAELHIRREISASALKVQSSPSGMTIQGDAPEWATARARQLVTSSETILGVWVVSDANRSRAAMQPLVPQHGQSAAFWLGSSAPAPPQGAPGALVAPRGPQPLPYP